MIVVLNLLKSSYYIRTKDSDYIYMIAGIINNQRDANRAHCHPAYGSVNKGSKIRAYEIWIMMIKNKDSGRYRRSSPTKN